MKTLKTVYTIALFLTMMVFSSLAVLGNYLSENIGKGPETVSVILPSLPFNDQGSVESWNTTSEANIFDFNDYENRDQGSGIIIANNSQELLILTEKKVIVGAQEILDRGNLAQSLADDTGGIKQLGYVQQRNELRNSDGHDQGGTPELLKLDTLLVDHDCNEHSKEIVGEGSEEGPHQGPAEDFTEGQTKSTLTEIGQLIEVFQTNPTEQVGVAVVRSIVAGEGHQNHVNDGQNGEDDDAGQRQSQQSLVELIVDQRADIILAALDTLAAGGNVHADAALLDLQTPGPDKCDDKHNRQKAIEHDLDGIVAGDPVLGDDLHTVSLSNGFLEAALNRADGCTGLEPVALGQPVNTAAGEKHVCDKHYFEQEEEQTSHDLAVVDIAKTK